MKKLTIEDVQIFYEILSRYNLLSSNIAVVGNKQKFDRITKEIISNIQPNQKVIQSADRRKISIYENDVEKKYIYIETYDDMRGYTFRKFM